MAALAAFRGRTASTSSLGSSSSRKLSLPSTTTRLSVESMGAYFSYTLGKTSPSMEPVRSSSTRKPIMEPFFVTLPRHWVRMPAMLTERPSYSCPLLSLSASSSTSATVVKPLPNRSRTSSSGWPVM